MSGIMRRLLRGPINWAVERYFDDGVFFGNGFIEDMDRITHEKATGTKVASGVVGYLIYQALLANADYHNTTIKGMSINGEMVGDWSVTIERIKNAPP